MNIINTPAYSPWLSAFLTIAKHYRIAASEENIRVNLNWERGATLDELLTSMSRQLGLSMRTVPFSTDLLDPWRLPIVVEFKTGQVAVIEKIDREGNASVQFSGDHGLTSTLSAADIQKDCKRIILLRPENTVADARVDDYIQPYQPNWFWSIVLRDWKRYGDIVLASLIANVLALAAMVFSMQVYDRVIPAQSIPTLWVLAGGVGIAFLFEYLLRILRIHISDLIGKRADLRVSDRVFGHALRIKNSQRSKSTGSFIAQIRELESVRELVTSTTVGTVADLPFFFLFLFIFILVGGNLVWIPLAAIPLIFIPGILAQPSLARLSQEGMRESSIRNAMLVEAVQGLDDIKLLRAEPRFQNQWNHMNEVSATVSMKQRMISGLLTSWTQTVQSLMYVLVILAGSFMVMDGDMTTGALVACSILASRMIGPLANITGLFVRLQQAKVAKKSLDELMKREVDQSDAANQIQRPVLHGQYHLQGVRFKYNEDDQNYVLGIADLKINAGEKVAILGKNGAGKTTLLQIMSGLQQATSGKAMLDDLDMTLIDPSDVRRDVGMLGQQASLFFGTVRENLTLGAPLATDEAVLKALKFVGLLDYIQTRKEGLDYLILEGGVGLSGGQKQALLLARTLIREPNVLLLDEPTAWLDDVSEKRFIDNMKEWLGHRTLVVATHRLAVLALVDRIIVMNDGKVVMDGTKEQILSQNKNGTAPKAPAAPPAPVAAANNPAVTVKAVSAAPEAQSSAPQAIAKLAELGKTTVQSDVPQQTTATSEKAPSEKKN